MPRKRRAPTNRSPGRAAAVVLAVVLTVTGLTVIAPATAGGAASATASQFRAVSCTSATFCMAVGEHATSSGGGATLAERWNGSGWSIVASPNPAGSKFSRLYAVSCTSPSSCFAAGSQYNARTGASKTLVERWNGKTWSIVADAVLPGPQYSGAFLFGVDCASTTFCFAVGQRAVGDPGGSLVLVERWNGHGWSLATTPKVTNTSYLRLNGVSCTSTLRCVAVGYYGGPDGRLLPLAERWNGTAWTRVPSEDTKELGEGDLPESVSCASATNCFAAGEYELGGDGRPATFVQHWDGKSFRIVTSADPARSYSALEGVSCTSATSCVAVGRFQKPRDRFDFGPTMTLAERWNGKTWVIDSSPNPGAGLSDLAAVSCWSTAHCFAVGVRAGSSNQTLTERWNGTKWAVVASPNPTT